MRIALFALLAAALLAAPAAAAPPPPHLAVWMEVSANLPIYASRERIVEVLDRMKAAGVTDVVPEAKNAWGFVLYESAFAPHIRTSPVPRTQWPAYDAPATWFPQDIDPLRVVIEEAHARGLRVHAAVNVFGEGLNAAGLGPAFERAGWMAQHMTPGGTLIPGSQVGIVAFANPAHPEVQLYELAVLQEVVSRYEVDGIVLDRIRFPDGTADFSDLSRARFEAHLGRPVESWPDDVLSGTGEQLVQGPLFPEWVAWRARIIQQFVRAAEAVVHGNKPAIAFGAYVGGWYPTYWQEGVNWASRRAPTSSWPELSWVGAPWQEAAVGEMLDYLMVGLFYGPVRALEALRAGSPGWMSVEGGALMARDLLAGGAAPVGSLYLLLYEHQPEQFRAALETVLSLHGGAMLFDLVYLERYGWWSLLPAPARAGP